MKVRIPYRPIDIVCFLLLAFLCYQAHQVVRHLVGAALDRYDACALAYCLMGNHWHFVVRPTKAGQMSRFFRWLTLTHAMRWRVSHNTVGYGHLYQGRYKSFPVEPGASLLNVCRYVERNALTTGEVHSAEDWRWSSLWVRQQGTAAQRSLLCDWPTQRPADWIRHVNAVITAKEKSRWELSLARGRPFGDDQWTVRTLKKTRLEHITRAEGGAHGRKGADNTCPWALAACPSHSP